ncbi:hypothetical protein N8762_00575 [Candidatus Marinamargulisbacteria bacterium]|nr:hypothetical protein [Candidatus Marinamargulisbacteria bacterium]
MRIPGSGLRQEYIPVHPQERPIPPAREPQLTCPSRQTIGQYTVAAIVLYVNYIASFDRCIDGYSAGPLVPTNSIRPDQYSKLLNLSKAGYLVATPSGFEATDQLVKAIHQEGPDPDLAKSLQNAGIDPDPKGFTSEHCQYTLLEFLSDVGTGHPMVFCPPYHFPETTNTTCRLWEQDSDKNQAEKRQTTSANEFLANPEVKTAK